MFCEVTCLGKPESLEEEELETHSEAVIYGSGDELHHGLAQWCRILGVSVIFILSGGKEQLVTSQK